MVRATKIAVIAKLLVASSLMLAAIQAGAVVESSKFLPPPLGLGDSNYQIIANQTRFAAVGSIVLGLTVPAAAPGETPELCTGTLIGPYTVITAAHCVFDLKTGKPLDQKVLENWTFVFGPSVMTPSHRLRIWNYWVVPGYLPPTVNGDAELTSGDIALLQVYDESTITGAVDFAAPATLYTAGNELDGLNFPVFVGYGLTGFGTPPLPPGPPFDPSNPPTLTDDGVKRFYEEASFSIGSVPPFPANDRIITKFLSPSDELLLGLPITTFLEGSPAAGDSGAPWFYIDPVGAPGVWAIAAINSYGNTAKNYEESNGLTRISPIASTILANLRGAPTSTWSTIPLPASQMPSTLLIALAETPTTYSTETKVTLSGCSSDLTFSMFAFASDPGVRVDVSLDGISIGSITGLGLVPSVSQFTYTTAATAACAANSGMGFAQETSTAVFTMQITGPSGSTLSVSSVALDGLPNGDFSQGIPGIAITGAASITVTPNGSSSVVVPNVVGLTQTAATTSIAAVGLTLGTVTTQSSATVAAGLVISENPVAGTSVASGSAVNITVSSGPAPVAVPNVIGLTQAAATTAITSAGLTVGTVTTQSSSTVATGLVISESPTAGTTVAAKSAVNLIVSSGAAPVSVPNVVGLTQAAATAAITTAGLTVGTVSTQNSSTIAAGLVISETPTAGTTVAANSAVSIVVSSGAAPVAVPNVVGFTQAAATTAITTAGLTLGSVTTQNSSTVAAGLVISESPAAGTSVAAKSAVSLVVSSGAAPVSVPNVVGLTQAAATTTITAAGLTLGSVTTQSSATIAAGLVISEAPTAGTSVPAKSAVNLIVSSGAAPVAVPNVVGLTQAAAATAITGAGLTLGSVTTQSSATVAAGLVISESPAAGTSVAAKSAVSIAVSTGSAPVSVPNVVGSTQAAATTAITNAGLVVGTVTSQSSATIAAGIVISESPAAGTSVAAKSAVSLIISTGSLLGDLNGDGVVNCADLAIIKAAFGKRVGQAGFDARADVNSDGVVNILDLSAEARLMPAGTSCN